MHMNSNLKFLSSVRMNRVAVSALLIACGGVVACGTKADGGGNTDRVDGQSDFVSSPPGQQSGGRGEGAADAKGTSTGTGGGLAGLPSVARAAAPDRKVEETDLYRVEGDRLYYLNGYRGLMVFDISNVDAPKLIGRSQIFGSPVEMIVRNGVATVVVADWYGRMDDGKPFHGSIVRGLDATDPANIRVLGEAKLGGWVRDTRVVGDVLYAVSDEYNWSYGWAEFDYGVGVSGGPSGNKVVVSSVSFGGGVIRQVDRQEAGGYGGVFNVTPTSIMFAHDLQPPSQNPNVYVQGTQTGLDYLDISDPAGRIVRRGSVAFDGHLQAYGTDNGRWNLDFADGKFAHVLGCSGQYCGSPQEGYLLLTADFSNPDAPVIASKLNIPASGWSPAARFDKGRMYLSPGDGYYYGSGQNETPIQIFDISNPNLPRLAGQTKVSGNIWNFTPAGDRLFALGNTDYNPQTNVYGTRISLRYLDVTDPTKPVIIGDKQFGEGWAWTPAAGTFKAFTKNDTDGLVVLPFSGWSPDNNKYNNGLQIIEFTPQGLGGMGTAPTKGWVERGIFARGRLFSLSDLSLAVVDYSNHGQPVVKAELTLARNVVDARPHGETIAQLSSDWYYENDQDHSELRVLPTAQADENTSGLAVSETSIDGINAREFHQKNGKLSYIVSNVRRAIPCTGSGFFGATGTGGDPGGKQPTCYAWTQQVQVVDYVDGKPVLRGKVALPEVLQNYYSYYGRFYGCYVGDWYYGDEIVQVGDDVLAFRRWLPQYWANGEYADSLSSLFIVNLKDADKPTVASTVITRDHDGWWGNLRAIGDTLYATHYEWFNRPVQYIDGSNWYVRYYLDRIDLTDPSKPQIGSRINVPGIVVGGSETDPSIVYTIDYRWYGNHGGNEFDVLKLSGDKAYLEARLDIPGYVGNTFVRGNKAYMSVQQYTDDTWSKSFVRLWQLDMTDPRAIKTLASKAEKGWGWLLGVEGDRALVTSGWGSDGIDIYRLGEGAPVFDQFVRTVGWGASSLARQDDQLFLASGHWGVQTVNLKK